MIVVAGLGFSSNCRPAELAELVQRAQAAAHRHATALATPAWKAGAAVVAGAAELLALPVVAVEADRLAAAEGGILTQSEASRAAAGVGCVAEAAALAAAGAGARLILARIASAHATCALAEGNL